MIKLEVHTISALIMTAAVSVLAGCGDPNCTPTSSDGSANSGQGCTTNNQVDLGGGGGSGYAGITQDDLNGKVGASSKNTVRVEGINLNSDGSTSHYIGSSAVVQNPQDPNDTSLYLLTAKHVVYMPENHQLVPQLIYDVDGQRQYVNLDSSNVISNHGFDDQALIRIPDNALNRSMLQTVRTDFAKEGETVYITGFRHGENVATVIQGTVLGNGYIQTDVRDENHGMSGGLISDLAGNDLGNYQGFEPVRISPTQIDEKHTTGLMFYAPISSTTFPTSVSASYVTTTSSDQDSVATTDQGDLSERVY